MLRYVVEEALAGRGERIKAYTVAVEVFGRDEAFDANADPAVRLEAGRLRRALERYYLVAGRADLVLIGIPKGGYVPAFTTHPRGNEGRQVFLLAVRCRVAGHDGVARLLQGLDLLDHQLETIREAAQPGLGMRR